MYVRVTKFLDWIRDKTGIETKVLTFYPFFLYLIVSEMSRECEIFWPILTILLQTYTLFGVLFTSIDNAAAYQK